MYKFQAKKIWGKGGGGYLSLRPKISLGWADVATTCLLGTGNRAIEANSSTGRPKRDVQTTNEDASEEPSHNAILHTFKTRDKGLSGAMPTVTPGWIGG